MATTEPCKRLAPFTEIGIVTPESSLRTDVGEEISTKNTICLWLDGTAADAAQFSADTFPDSSVGSILTAPGDYPDAHEGAESTSGWCRDKWGVSWQITRRALLDAISDPDRAAAKGAYEAMMGMKRIDIVAIEAARQGL